MTDVVLSEHAQPLTPIGPPKDAEDTPKRASATLVTTSKTPSQTRKSRVRKVRAPGQRKSNDQGSRSVGREEKMTTEKPQYKDYLAEQRSKRLQRLKSKGKYEGNLKNSTGDSGVGVGEDDEESAVKEEDGSNDSKDATRGISAGSNTSKDEGIHSNGEKDEEIGLDDSMRLAKQDDPQKEEETEDDEGHGSIADEDEASPDLEVEGKEEEIKDADESGGQDGSEEANTFEQLITEPGEVLTDAAPRHSLTSIRSEVFNDTNYPPETEKSVSLTDINGLQSDDIKGKDDFDYDGNGGYHGDMDEPNSLGASFQDSIGLSSDAGLGTTADLSMLRSDLEDMLKGKAESEVEKDEQDDGDIIMKELNTNAPKDGPENEVEASNESDKQEAENDKSGDDEKQDAKNDEEQSETDREETEAEIPKEDHSESGENLMKGNEADELEGQGSKDDEAQNAAKEEEMKKELEAKHSDKGDTESDNKQYETEDVNENSESNEADKEGEFETEGDFSLDNDYEEGISDFEREELDRLREGNLSVVVEEESLTTTEEKTETAEPAGIQDKTDTEEEEEETKEEEKSDSGDLGSDAEGEEKEADEMKNDATQNDENDVSTEGRDEISDENTGDTEATSEKDTDDTTTKANESENKATTEGEEEIQEIPSIAKIPGRYRERRRNNNANNSLRVSQSKEDLAKNSPRGASTVDVNKIASQRKPISWRPTPVQTSSHPESETQRKNRKNTRLFRARRIPKKAPGTNESKDSGIDDKTGDDTDANEKERQESPKETHRSKADSESSDLPPIDITLSEDGDLSGALETYRSTGQLSQPDSLMDSNFQDISRPRTAGKKGLDSRVTIGRRRNVPRKMSTPRKPPAATTDGVEEGKGTTSEVWVPEEDKLYVYTYSSQPRLLQVRRMGAGRVTTTHQWDNDPNSSFRLKIRGNGNPMYDRRVVRGSNYAKRMDGDDLPKWNPYFSNARSLTLAENNQATAPQGEQTANNQSLQLRRQEFRQKLEARARLRRETHGVSSLYPSHNASSSLAHHPHRSYPRTHVHVQTENYYEPLERPPEADSGVQTDPWQEDGVPITPYVPPVPRGVDVATQVYHTELNAGSDEEAMVVAALVGTTLREAVLEVTREEHAEQERIARLAEAAFSTAKSDEPTDGLAGEEPTADAKNDSAPEEREDPDGKEMSPDGTKEAPRIPNPSEMPTEEPPSESKEFTDIQDHESLVI